MFYVKNLRFASVSVSLHGAEFVLVSYLADQIKLQFQESVVFPNKFQVRKRDVGEKIGH